MDGRKVDFWRHNMAEEKSHGAVGIATRGLSQNNVQGTLAAHPGEK